MKPFERDIPRFPAYIDGLTGQEIPAEARPEGMPTVTSSIFIDPLIVQSANFVCQFTAKTAKSNDRSSVLRQVWNTFSKPAEREKFHRYVYALLENITSKPEEEKTTEDGLRIQQYTQLIEKTSFQEKQTPQPAKPIEAPEEKDYTRIFGMPYRWLTQEERVRANRNLFSPSELNWLDNIKKFNLDKLEEADAIVIGLRPNSGFLGDALQESRLAGLLYQRYPNKVYVWTNHPDVFGKYRPTTAMMVNNRKVHLTFKESYTEAQQTKSFGSVFVLDPNISCLTSGLFIDRGAPAISIGTKESIPLDDVEFIHIMHVAQIMWENLYGGSVDALPDPAITISPSVKEKSALLYRTLPVSQQQNFVIHPDAHTIAWSGKHWETEKWIDLVKKIEQQYPDAHVFISQGKDHPRVSKKIAEAFSSQQFVSPLPSLSLPEYIGLLGIFPTDNTIFIGLESMPGSHLAPSLGLRSIVLGDNRTFGLHYGPWKGFLVASNNPEKSVVAISVAKVLEAIRIAKEE